VTEPAHAEDLFARLVAGQVDGEVLRWLGRGCARWSRADGAQTLERCLGLMSTPGQRRRRRRNALLQQVAAELPDDGTPVARRVHAAWETFLSRGPWRAWRDLDAPPAGAAELHAGLFWLSKLNDGDILSVWHIGDLLRGFFADEIPRRSGQDEGLNTTTATKG
jgi:hypothetical protein